MSLITQPVKRTPRAMPVETIITRFKSAQQKKLQEPKQKKVKKVTIKKNKPDSKKSVLHLKVEEKQPREELKQIIENNEFYPNRQKRNIVPKKIVLMPKHRLKMVGGTKSSNKRKLHLPKKDINQIRNTLNDSQLKTKTELNVIKVTKPRLPKTAKDVSLPDLVRIIEESGTLDDEDFLEILTCPSPVWWEDPPHGYIEEAIYTRKPAEQSNKSQNAEQTEVEVNKIESDNLVNNLVLNIDNKGKNFIKKRGKLEILLNNIRDKINNTEVTDIKNTFTNIVENNKNVNIFTNEIINKREKKNSDSLDEDQLLDLRDDEVLRHLENIDIPIENVSDLNQTENKLRKEAIDYDSDKNMSIVEEYLDMSYFEDDDIKDNKNKSDISMDLKNYDSNDLSPERLFKRFQKESNSKKDIKKSNTVKDIYETNTEYVAIYKIIESDDDEKKPEIKNRNINTYYKHKKFKPNQKKTKCVCNFKNKSIKVSDTESVKYCLICSSIYDTDECKYCLEKLNGNCKCKSEYTCDVCNLRMGSKKEIIRHLKDHNMILYT